jgi:phosphopentomutase
VPAASSIERTVTAFTRVIVIVLDSLGVGELPDAAAYGDQGSNTLGNIARQVPLHLPTLRALGIGRLVELPGFPHQGEVEAAYGKMAERAPGKDSVTGHWELMGLVLNRPFPVFANGFPRDVISEFERRIGRKTLGNFAASGTVIIEDLGPEHIRTGAPIVYTSADSVFQIAAHEEVVPVDELYRQCRVAYELVVDGLGVGRVIARPFVGTPGRFQRTANRRDFSLPPVGQTVLDRARDAGLPVIGIGKIEDLFAGHGITRAVHTKSDDEGMDEIERAMAEVDRGIIIANLVDFDSRYGHRNDVQGYAANLERIDARISEVLARLSDPDLLVLTADHGNDPTTPSTDHSREYVPLIVAGSKVRAGSDLGVRSTFADLGQTLADVFSLPPMPDGTSFLGEI